MKNIFDLPKILWLALLGGDVLIGYLGYQTFVQLKFSNPLLIEVLALLGINIALLLVRAYFPNIWKALTTEDVNDK